MQWQQKLNAEAVEHAGRTRGQVWCASRAGFSRVASETSALSALSLSFEQRHSRLKRGADFGVQNHIRDCVLVRWFAVDDR